MIGVQLFLLKPFIVSAQQISPLAGCKRYYSGYVMLDRKLNSAKTRLENHTHIEYKHKQKIYCVRHLPEKGRNNEVNYVQSYYGCCKDYYA